MCVILLKNYSSFWKNALLKLDGSDTNNNEGLINTQVSENCNEDSNKNIIISSRDKDIIRENILQVASECTSGLIR